MDKQIIQSAIKNLAPVPHESKPPKIGNDVEIFRAALEGKKIITASEDELKSVLRYCMVLVGLKSENFPEYEEKDMLLHFIIKNYGKHSLAEIRLAFDLAVTGKLSVNAVCYENFSVIYFSSIMNAYRKWSSNVYEENQLYNEPDKNALPPAKSDWKELCELRYQDYLTGKYSLDHWPHELYDEFVNSGYMAADVWESCTCAAIKILEARLKQEKLDAQLARNEGLENQINLKWHQLHAQRDKHFLVVSLAKKLAVQYLYSEAKKREIKNLFIKE